MKKIHKFAIVFVLLIVLFLSLSCGIPSYLTLAIDTPATPETTNRTINISDIRINATQNLALFNSNEVVSASPSITFFYTISNSASQPSDLQSKFNTLYSSQYTTKPKSTNVTEDSNSSVAEYTSLNITNRLFVLKNEGNNWESPIGHINKSNLDSTNNTEYRIFNFDINQITNSEGQVYFTVSYTDKNNDKITIDLKRYDKSYFTKSKPTTNNNDYNAVEDTDSNRYVYIYAAVNVVGSSSATFTNRFWSNLLYLGQYSLN